jgi:hypothetical protein
MSLWKQMVKICSSHQNRHYGSYLHNFNAFIRPNEDGALIYFLEHRLLAGVGPMRVILNS